MVGSTKDKPLTPTTTTKTSETAGPKPAVVPDDGIPVEELAAGQTLVDGMSDPNGMSLGAPAPTTTPKPPAKTEAAPTSAKASDPGAVAKMMSGVIGKLEPGNTAKLGGKAELSSGYTIGGEANIEVKRTDKGKYEVKIDQRAFLGAGTENGEGHHKTGAKAVGVAAGEVTLEFATAEEAAAFTAKATTAAAAGQLLMPIGPGGAQVAVGVAIGTSREHISEVKVEYGIEVEADVEKHLIGPLEAIGGAAGEATGALVFVPPDEAFMELKVKGELKAEVLAKVGPGSVGVGGGMEGTLTVRIPLGHVASAEEMAKPEVQQRLREQAERNPEGTTMSWESKIIVPGMAGNVTRTSEKTINGNSLEEMFNGKDFNTRMSVDVGPNPHGGVGPLTVEVTAQRSVTLLEVNDGTLAEQDKEIAAQKSQIENKALKAKAKG